MPTTRQPLLHLLLVVSLALTFLTGACDVAEQLGGPLANTDNYNMNTTCENQTPLEACEPCCEGLGFELALVATGDCGCAAQVRDAEVCKDSNATFEACAACCEKDPTNVISSLSNGACRCTRISKTKNENTNVGNHDGCTAADQACTCSNTNLPGKCGTGTAKSGLYCQCD